MKFFKYFLSSLSVIPFFLLSVFAFSNIHLKWYVDIPSIEGIDFKPPPPKVDKKKVFVPLNGKKKAKILILNGFSGHIEKTLTVRGRFIYTLALYGNFFTVGVSDKKVYLFRKDGKLIKTFRTKGYPVGITAFKIKPYNRFVLAVLDDYENFYLLDGQRLIPYWIFKDGSFDLWNGPPAIGHMGKSEVIAVGGFGYVWVLNPMGSLLKKYYVEKTVYKSPVMCDVDKDGNDEILAGVTQNVLIMKDDKERIAFITNGDVNSLATFYVKKQNLCILLVSDDDGYFYLYQPLKDRSFLTLKVKNGTFLPPAVVEVKEGYPAVITITTKGKLYILRGDNGNIVFSKQLPFNPLSFSVGDTDGNGYLDLVLVIAAGKIIDLELPLKVEKFIWLPPNGNLQNTNNPSFSL